MSKLSPGRSWACWKRSAMCHPRASKVTERRQEEFSVPSKGVCFSAAKSSSVGMTTGRGQDGGIAQFAFRVFRRSLGRRSQLQLDMLLFHHAGRRDQAHVFSDENRLGIPHAEGFDAPQNLKQLGRYLIEREFGIVLKDRFEVGQSQTRPRILVQMRTQLRQARRRKRETDSVGMSAEAGEQTRAGLKRIQQMKWPD